MSTFGLKMLMVTILFDLQAPESLDICLRARLVGLGSRCRGAASRHQATGLKGSPVSTAGAVPSWSRSKYMCAPVLLKHKMNTTCNWVICSPVILKYTNQFIHLKTLKCPTVWVWSLGEQPLCTVSFKVNYCFTVWQAHMALPDASFCSRLPSLTDTDWVTS